MLSFLKGIFGKKSDRRAATIAKYKADIDRINELWKQLEGLSEDELKGKTDEFRTRLANGETEADLMYEAFAVVKEACRRLVGTTFTVTGRELVWNMVPYDVQLIGAIALFRGMVAEMATGEGKTLVATMPLYLNALSGKSAHLVTVNDYLAERDAQWMGLLYNYLGLTAGVITSNMDADKRQQNYACDITYGTNSQFGFDFLRDNMVMRKEDMVQRGFNYVIVDECDSVLIDEARTPLIIAGPVEKSTHKFGELKDPVKRLVSDQQKQTRDLVTQARKLMESEKEEDQYQVGVLLLQAQHSMPKLPEFIEIIKEEGIKRLITRVENDRLREKNMHLLDQELFFSIDERNHIIDLQDNGRHKLAQYTGQSEDMFVLPDLSTEIVKIQERHDLSEEERLRLADELNSSYSDRSERIHNISQLLRAYTLYEKDVEYVVQDNKVQIVDEYTGRVLHGRRFSDGLHQALEAKEGVAIERETQTVASITLQNFFRSYRSLAGMTGTAATEAGEFWDIYKLEVCEIPTNDPVIRMDRNDLIYRTKKEKYAAIVEKIAELHEKKQPVLVGTISVEVSEIISRLLTQAKVPHNVLNAKQHQREAETVANAGQPGAVTIATNMAGRGTDIKLGEGVIHQGPNGPEGGLFILGTERHESRRIDLQLRGRSGRQGDPGESVFFLSLEDDLMRLFGSERIAGVMDRLGLKEGEVITHGMITNSIEKAQKRVEEQNYAIRRHLIEYDDVLNSQRNTIYARRQSALQGENQSEHVRVMIADVADALVHRHCNPAGSPDEWSWTALRQDLMRLLVVNLSLAPGQERSITQDELIEIIEQETIANYERKAEILGEDLLHRLERFAIITATDRNWRRHLAEMDDLKAGIGFQAYAQKNPLTEYKRQGLGMFRDMLISIFEDAIQLILRAQVELKQEDVELRGQAPRGQASHQELNMLHSSGAAAPPTTSREEREVAKQQAAQPVRRESPRIGRNDPCPCGSGKKYKQCHGKGE